MTSDESQVRELVAAWMEASRAGDADRVMELVADDVVFLVAGRPPMRRDEFERAQRAQSAPGGPKVDGTAEVQEVQVSGDWGFLWTRLAVTVTPPGAAPVERAGHALTVVKRQRGRWVIARDANLLAPVQRPPA